MAELKTSFRATYGLDAGGEKVINVKKADKTVMTDGVNVEYLIQENTTQMYDPGRGYPKDFAVLFNGRLWYAKQATPVPAGPFNEGYWTPARTDPKWYQVDGNRTLQVGEYLTIDTLSVRTLELTLPSNAQEGDNIVIRDVGGEPGFADILIKAGTQSILDRGQRLKEIKMTIPYSEWTFVYVNKLWTLYNGSEADLGRTIRPADTPHLIQSGETIIRSYDKASPIKVRFPKNANNGDMIHFVGMDAATAAPYFHLELNSFDDNTNILAPGVKQRVIQRSLSGYFIFNTLTSTWQLYDADMTDRLRTVNSDTNLFPNETVSVVGTDNTTVANITLKLPEKVEAGDQITVALNYMRKAQTVNIVPSGNDKILTDKNMTQFPKRGSYPPSGNWINTTILTYNGTDDYAPIITFAYIPMGPIGQWMVVNCVPVIERVDPNNRNRLGVIALATQAQANLDYEKITPDAQEVAITPETLANRTAMTTRRGIARLAAVAEVNGLVSDGAWNPDIIVTPMTLDKKQATETMRGLAEIATQAETNGNVDDSRIITSKKLDGRRATPTLAGIAFTVAPNGAPPAKVGDNRDLVGTNVYNQNDDIRIVTPRVLREFKAVEQALGGVFLATDAEVINPPVLNAAYPLAVTPQSLHKKRADLNNIGFTQTASTQEVLDGTDNFKYVTPFTLTKRIATDTATGIARFAVQTEFNAGASNLIADPARIKTFFSGVRTTMTAAAGLTQSGNLWDGLTLNILPSSVTQRGTARLATQPEVDAGTDNTTIVTPLTLHTKKATEGSEGIIRIANRGETVAGAATLLAVSPANLRYVIQDELTWEATPTRRGLVKLSIDSTTWQGNQVDGNANINIETQFNKNGMAISPYEFNKTLRNYLPIKAKAVDSDLLDGIDSTQFIRRDIDQTVNGSITFTKSTQATTIAASDNIASSKLVTAATGFGINSTASDGRGISLYGTPYENVNGIPSYGLAFAKPDTFGTHGYVTGTHITYFTLSNGVNRGWVFKHSAQGTPTTGNVASINATGDAYFNGIVNTDTSFRIKNSNIISTDASNGIIINHTSRQLTFQTPDASDLRVTESGGNTYQVVTTKNLVNEGNKTYVRKDGDTMTGRLNVNQPITATIPQSSATPLAVPNANNFGTWIIDITDPAIYNTLRPYVVGVYAKNAETGEILPWFDKYDEFYGPGTLSQFGSSASNGSGTYQIWAPRPTAANASKPGHIAGTMWTRQWNPVTNKWDGWGRMFTNNHPPLPQDIGAMSNNGSVFDSMRIRDWIQIGNLRIYADPTTKNVRFDWID